MIVPDSNEILKPALNLTPTEKTKPIDRLLFSLDNPDKDLDKLWSRGLKKRRNQGTYLKGSSQKV
jgi:hypothetical protein